MRETMTYNDSQRIRALAATLSAGLLLAVFAAGTAHADAFAVSPAPTSVAGCNKLPLSHRDMCKSRVGWAQTLPASSAIDQTASARTAAEMKDCKSLPYGDKLVCEEQAGYGQKVPQGLAANQRVALTKATAEYKAAVEQCRRQPVSDRNICVSEAGYDSRLAQVG